MSSHFSSFLKLELAGAKKLGLGWVWVEYDDKEKDWLLLRPSYYRTARPGSWRLEPVGSSGLAECDFEGESDSDSDGLGTDSSDSDSD